MKPGIYHDVPRSEYDKLPYFNQSILKKWIELGIKTGCPAKFKWWLDHREEEQDTEAQVEGTVLDVLLLEPLKVEERFVVIPIDAPKKLDRYKDAKKPNQATLDAIKWWEEFREKAAGRPMVKYAVYEECRRMARALKAQPRFAAILEHCQKTVVIGELNGHMCKAEIDLFPMSDVKSDVIYDLKKTKNATNNGRIGFGKDAEEFGYDIQAAFYLDISKTTGINPSLFGFWMVEDTEPHFTRDIMVSGISGTVKRARQKYKEAMDTLAEHIEKYGTHPGGDPWPGYRPCEELQLPEYAQAEADLA